MGRLLRAALSALTCLALASCSRAAPPAEQITLPEGFHLSVFSDAVPGARSLTLGAGGTVFVGTRGEGKVYALVDGDGDGRAERRYVIARGLNTPNGVACYRGALYVAEINRIIRFDDIEARLAHPPAPVTVSEALPEETHHGWRYIGFGPDGCLYIAVGAPCNVCERDGFAQIRRLDPASGRMEVVARGVRNSVGFDWHPQSGVLWFTDNGRDWLGDDQPPDELNRAPRSGLHFGFPYCHGGDIPDPDFGRGHSCADYTAPVQRLGPHVAALGMRFYTGRRFPARYRNQVFIAEHGSWNRSRRIGYRITLVRLEGGRAIAYETFASGWLRRGRVSGRPVDLQVMPDGALLVSDDQNGVVYRIDYRPR